MGPSAAPDPLPNDKPEILEHSNKKVSSVLMLITVILAIATVAIFVFKST
ncbi:MAG: hypothetical protein ABI972_08480 [Acidobacteriota bacterium]